ncbi:MAG TPA: chemotaxis protein CheW [Thermoanaerobaculia bacterium]|jgi:purine-binding chemotaxis protein CheW
MSARNLRFIAFRTGPETFLIDIMAVRQIVMAGKSTSVPTAPSFIEGVIVFRNEVIPVVDVHARLYPKREHAADQPLVLLTHTTAGVIGLKVDEVRRIVTLGSEELLPAPAMVRGIRGEFLVAIAQQNEEIFLVLDINSLLTADEQRELRAASLS